MTCQAYAKASVKIFDQPMTTISGDSIVNQDSIYVYSSSSNTVNFDWSVSGGEILSDPFSNSIEVKWTAEQGILTPNETLIDIPTCFNTAEVTVRVENVTGLNWDTTQQPRVYPNPVSENINIVILPHNIAKGNKIELINDKGQSLLTYLTDERNANIDLTDIPEAYTWL